MVVVVFAPVSMVTREAISPLFSAHEMVSGRRREYRELTGLPPMPFFEYYENGVLHFYGDGNYAEKLADAVLERARREPGFLAFLRRRHVETCAKMVEAAEAIASADLKNASSAELAALWATRMDCHEEMFSYAWLSFMAAEPLEARALESLRHKAVGASLADLQRYFTILTTSPEESWSRLEEKGLLAIAVRLDRDAKAKEVFIRCKPEELEGKLPALWAELLEHAGKWQWLPYEYDGNDVWIAGHFAKELKVILEGGSVAERLAALEARSRQIRAEKAEAVAKLGLAAGDMVLFDLIAELIYLKEYRNGLRCKANFLSEPLLREAAKRRGTDIRRVRYLFPGEMPAFLEGGMAISELEARYACCAFHSEYGGEPRLEVGEAARASHKRMLVSETSPESGELRGRCASPGRVRGIARVVLDARESHRVQQGDVLVTRMTTPDFVPAMKRAVAIVTDDGGITCHAAIISRELGVPCVVGTRVATKVLKDGDAVEVAAHEGVVKKL